jgi:hypothetical protein
MLHLVGFAARRSARDIALQKKYLCLLCLKRDFVTLSTELPISKTSL